MRAYTTECVSPSESTGMFRAMVGGREGGRRIRGRGWTEGAVTVVFDLPSGAFRVTRGVNLRLIVRFTGPFCQIDCPKDARTQTYVLAICAQVAVRRRRIQHLRSNYPRHTTRSLYRRAALIPRTSSRSLSIRNTNLFFISCNFTYSTRI